MNNIRDKFEQKFPFPIGVKFHSDGDYIWLGGNHHGDTCEPYDSMWKAWQAATEQSQKEIAELEAKLNELVKFQSSADRLAKAQAESLNTIAELKAREKVLVEALGTAQDELTHLSHHTREDYARDCVNKIFNSIEQALANVNNAKKG